MAGKKIGEAFLRVRPDLGDFTKEATPKATEAGKKTGQAFGSSFGATVKGLAGLAAGGAILSFFKSAIDEQRESIKIGQLTAAVLKSTGGAAKLTAKDVGDLAGRLSDLAGVDDEVIQSAENVLLTFTNIRNEVGKGNDVFDQATAAALDMSVALGQDLQSSVIQLGKALNDPVKGITALQRVGVSFTAEQREQIAAMVDAGHTMEAQKVILAELTKEFGGAAAAAASPADKARVAWGNFQEAVGAKLLPTLDNLLSFGVKNQAWLIPLVGAVAKLGVVVGTVVVAEKAWNVVQSVVNSHLNTTAGRVKRTAFALGGLLTVLSVLKSATAVDISPQIDAVTTGLADWATTGKLAGESARLFGADAGKLDEAFKQLANDARGNSIQLWLEGIVPGIDHIDDSATKMTERVKAMDSALAQLVQSGNGQQATDILTAIADRTGISIEKLKELLPEYAGAAEVAAKGTTKLAASAVVAAVAGKTLAQVWDELNGKMLTSDEVMLAAHKSVDDVRDAFKEGTKSIAGNSEAALENRIALEKAGRAAQDAAQDYLDNGGSAKGAAKILKDFKDEAIKATGATGNNAKAVKTLADELFRLPEVVNVRVNVDVDAHATSRIRAALDRATRGFASGGLVDFRSFAAGGLEQHVAQIVRAGTTRVWNEPETGGEAYIPLALSKRARSTAVLSEIARRFGMALVPVNIPHSTVAAPAAGPARASGAWGGGGVHVEHLHVTAYTDRFSLAQIQQELALLGAH
jgi:hypothetical protein